MTACPHREVYEPIRTGGYIIQKLTMYNCICYNDVILTLVRGERLDKDSMRVQVTMPLDLVADVDKAAKKLNLSRSSYITMIVSQNAEQRRAMETLQTMSKMLVDADDSRKEQIRKVFSDIDDTKK